MAPTIDANAVWLVTGCSSGLGKSFAQHIHRAGHNIIATARNTDALQYLPEGPKVLKRTLDVTSPESIAAAIDAIVQRFGRLDVVINNAGYNAMTEFEGFPEDEARKMMETMFWGPVNITRQALRVFREINAPGQGGTIVQLTSIGGYLAYQGNSFYHSSKFALEGFTKSVAKEVNPKWNISFLIVSPGGVKTNFAPNMNAADLPRHPAYANDPEAPFNPLLQYLRDPSTPESFADSEKCAKVVFDAVVGQKDRPLPVRLNLGADSLPMMRGEVAQYIKEMDDWGKETLSVMPSKAGSAQRVDQFVEGK